MTLWRGWVLIAVLTTLMQHGCAPLPEAEYWDGFFRHLHPPRYSFQVPDGWRPATSSDHPLLGFNRHLFQTLDEAGRSAAMQRAEQEMQGQDAVLVSSRGAWIQSGSQVGAKRWYAFGSLRFGLDEREKQAIWRSFSTSLIQSAPPADKPTLGLESIDAVDYSPNRVVRLSFQSDGRRGPMHWTVLAFNRSFDLVTIAHVGIPEDRNEGIAGLEVIAHTFRFD